MLAQVKLMEGKLRSLEGAIRQELEELKQRADRSDQSFAAALGDLARRMESLGQGTSAGFTAQTEPSSSAAPTAQPGRPLHPSMGGQAFHTAPGHHPGQGARPPAAPPSGFQYYGAYANHAHNIGAPSAATNFPQFDPNATSHLQAPFYVFGSQDKDKKSTFEDKVAISETGKYNDT